MSLFTAVEMAPRDPILGLNEQFNADTNPNKVNLGVGVYFDDNGKLPLLQCVQAAEKTMMEKPTARGYLPIDGIVAYDNAVKSLVFGADSEPVKSGRVATVQAIGGTGGLKIGADFLKKVSPNAKVLISDPSWENHRALFTNAGFEVDTYAYYDAEKRGVNFEGFLASLNAAAPGTIVVLHACCHNPTGFDLAPRDWKRVLEVVKARELLPLIDFAYQGFGDGIDEDAWAVRLFAAELPELLVTSSCSKNFGLYRERTGALIVRADKLEKLIDIRSQLAFLARNLWSTPPSHGAAVVAEILGDAELKSLWTDEVDAMRRRVADLRSGLVEALRPHGLAERFAHIAEQRGMFSYTGLTPAQVQRLRDEFSVYLVSSGRASVAGMSEARLDYLAGAIARACQA